MTGDKLSQARLKYEKNELEKYYRGEKFLWKKMWTNGMLMAAFERNVTTNRGNVYRLRILVGENYPNQLPDLVVCSSPKPMPTTPEWRGTYTTHTWPPMDGFLKIHFYHPLCWTRKNRLYQVFEKGEEWLEAYEEHLATDIPLNEFLPPMKLTKEVVDEEIRRKKEYARYMAMYDRNLLQHCR